MLTVCNKNQCAGCMLCVDICPKKAIKIEDSLKAYNAVIDSKKCVNCNLCHNKCPQNIPPQKMKPIKWYQGWNCDDAVRENAPSGGIGMALATQFVKDGGYVCSCVFDHGEFIFDVVNELKEIGKFSGSKYVKSNPQHVYSVILKLLEQGKKVLFIGLPCQLAALKKFIGEDYNSLLYLVDLICHGTPSPKILSIFLKQYNIDLKSISDLKFRKNMKYQVSIDNKGIAGESVIDKYSIAFMNGLICTQNCFSCHYASVPRISDITIGDSWGSALSRDEVKKGISLMLVQTNKGKELLEKSNVKLLDVDIENAKRCNAQLLEPMQNLDFQKSFLDGINEKNFNKRVFIKYKKDCLKQDIKHILLEFGLIK